MGDRGCVEVRGSTYANNEEKLFFYTHSSGSTLPVRVQRGIQRAEDNHLLNDFDYFNKILFVEILRDENGDIDERVLGYGVTNILPDYEHNQKITIDLTTGDITLGFGGVEMDISEFAIQDNPSWPK